MKTFKTLSFALLASLFLFASCKKDKKEEPKPTTPVNSSFAIEFEHVWGPAGAPFKFNEQIVHPATGDTITINLLKYYISNIVLTDETGNTWKKEDGYYLVDASDASKMRLLIDNVPSKNYTSISYLIGVDSTRNISGAQEGALSPSNDMFWDWNTGYIFVKCEGISPQSPRENNRVFYHIGGFTGTNNGLRTNNHGFGSSKLNVRANAIPTLKIKVNAARFWHGGIKIADVSGYHMPNANSATMATNFAGGFSYDSIEN